MLSLLRCRRGTMAFAFVIAAVPLIGMVALGAEAGSWYVTKQHAQNAADAAAYSGALRLACTAATGCDTQTVAQRGKQFAAQNAFCNAGDTTTPGCPITLTSGVSQAVTINTLTTWNSTPGNYVQAIVAQTEPVYLAGVLGLTTVSPGAQAVAQVVGLAKPPCALALSGSISFQGSPNINAPTCGMASNDTAKDALDFTGGGMSISLASLSAAGGCQGSSTFCGTALTYMPPITNPFSALDAVTLPTLTNCSQSGGLVAYSAANPCTNNGLTLNGQSADVLNGGVYFISGALTLKGGTSITGTALFILLPGASFSLKGQGAITLTANASVTNAQLPTVLQPYASLLAGMVMYDRDNVALTLGGNSSLTFNGNIYAPNVAMTFQGNPTVNACGELIAKSLAFNGNATFDNSGCSSATQIKSQQYVALVQ
jgi:Flp pilus assembly protein TadG